MALDSGYLQSVVTELREAVLDCKVDKVHQIDKDNLLLSFRGYKKSCRVILCANANNARLHITQKQYENPTTPPMFCMLLRKHLLGARLVAVEQPDFERVCQLVFEGYNELGELQRKTLAMEIMGRHSNIIFYDGEKRIIDAIRHVDITMSMARQVLPGMLYELPPAQNKRNPLTVSKEEIPQILERLAPEKRLDKELLGYFTGFSPLICRELAYRATGHTDATLAGCTELQRDKLAFYLWDVLESLQQGRSAPCMVVEPDSGKPREFSYMEIRQYAGQLEQRSYESPSKLLDEYYDLRDTMERMRQKSADVFRVVMNNLERVSKKLAIQQEELEQSRQRDQYRVYGDLLTANLYRMERGMTSVTVENYYEEGCPPVEIELDIRNTPNQNAQMYYRRYQKMKSKEEHLTRQVAESQEELRYLETVFDNIYKAENEKELAEMRQELREQGYLHGPALQKGAKRTVLSHPMHFVTDDGFDVYVGKNNKQNDELTLRTAERTDLWLHTKNAPGSHTILVTGGMGLDDLPVEAITQAAILAASYSSAKDSANVPVDYALVRHVKKPGGAKPGMVIYDHFYTAYVTPDEALASRLRQEKRK
ncbi:MAG: Rqc2 family fibronectin-binding protein [Eubacteriales bacterium]|jgi:predicted ribosome quality control (RQC) complex YloA/Tae2 family protein